MAAGLVRRALRSVLRIALEAIGPEPGDRPKAASVHKVEIRVASDVPPGQIARQVAEEIASMRRYRKNYPATRSFSSQTDGAKA